jgi:hypothetical protein
MKHQVGNRWVARTGDDGPEARAGALLRQALQREPVDASRLEAIRVRLRREKRTPQRHWMLRLAISFGLLASGGALTAAAQRYLRWPVPAPPASPPAPIPAAAPSAPARVPKLVPPAPAVPAPPPRDQPLPPHEVSPERAALGVSRRVALRSARFERAPVTPPPPAAAEPPSALAEESALIAEALRKLRQDHDAPAALTILEAHAQQFARGALAPEATLIRIEALLKTRRIDDALSLLDRTPPVSRGRGRDLLLARAELRAKVGRHAAALEDFDLLLAGNPGLPSSPVLPGLPADSIAERALWGRAACRAAAGDTAAARRDLQDYLSRFPGGRFASDARAALSR